MARSKQALTVFITASAQRDLVQIWQYNADHRSPRQADTWDSFLREKIEKLSTTYDDARTIEGFRSLKHVSVRKRARDDGHVLIYEVDESTKIVNILHVYHSKMDIEGRLKSEFE